MCTKIFEVFSLYLKALFKVRNKRTIQGSFFICRKRWLFQSKLLLYLRLTQVDVVFIFKTQNNKKCIPLKIRNNQAFNNSFNVEALQFAFVEETNRNINTDTFNKKFRPDLSKTLKTFWVVFLPLSVLTAPPSSGLFTDVLMAYFHSSSRPLKVLKWVIARINLRHCTEAGLQEEQNLLTRAMEPDETVICLHIKQFTCLNAIFVRNHTKQDVFWSSQIHVYLTGRLV